MDVTPELLLVGAVAAIGVLHTMVPDHWAPIALLARQRGWSKAETARAALQAGTGHVGSTLLIAFVVWMAGVAVATRFGHFVDTASSVALIAFGAWFGISALRELRLDDDASTDPLEAPRLAGATASVRHAHHHHGVAVGALHRNGSDQNHDHDHDHNHNEAAPNRRKYQTETRTALLLILGSSPMVEGIPVFFAAGKYGVGLILLMSIVFAASTIATYVVLCVTSTEGLRRVELGGLERYGEVLSGAFIALLGVAFWIWPVL